MRLSDLGYKEIVNLSNGSRHGQLADSDLIFDPTQGKIKGIIVPLLTSRFGFLGPHEFIEIPWDSVRKIGEDIIIFDADV